MSNITHLTKPIRVLHCVAGLQRGGYETFIMNVYRNIDRQKVQFDFLYSFDGVYTREAEKLGAKLFKIPFITQVGPFAYQKAVDIFLKNHKEYTIIHSHMDKFSGLIMERAKNAGVPVRIAHSHSTKNEGGFIFSTIKNFYGKKVDKNCTHRFACSEPAFKWLFNNNINKVIVRNGVELFKFNISDNRNANEFVITNIGRFCKTKNHTFLIDIFAQVYKQDSTARLLLAGTGALQQSIKAKVQLLNLSNVVEFLNDVDDIPSLLAKTDVFCLPSLFEGLGIVLIEAQAAGVPCVAADTIPKEAAVTKNIEFLPLNVPIKEWAELLLKAKSQPRQNSHDEIMKNGYDITTTAIELQQFYIENGNDL